MKSTTLVEQFVANPAHMRLFQQERAIYEVTELIEVLMGELGVSRADLAKRLGKTRGWVTQLLDGEANKTVRTVADVLAVLGHEFRSFSQPIRISTEAADARIHARSVAPSAGIEIDPRTNSVGINQLCAPAHTDSLQLEEVA